MKSFFLSFAESSKELKKVSTITVTGMLIAVSVVLRSFLQIPLNEDLRVTFSFLGVMAVGMLYGPVVCMMSAAGVDIIGYLLDGYKMREYSVPLLLVKLFIAIIYGVALYRRSKGGIKLSDKLKSKLPSVVTEYIGAAVFGIISRVIAVLLGNIVLNSAVLYKSYTNPNFPFMSGSEWSAFWVWFTPRLTKNLVMLPVECAAILLLLPAIYAAYSQVFKPRRQPRAVGG